LEAESNDVFTFLSYSLWLGNRSNLGSVGSRKSTPFWRHS